MKSTRIFMVSIWLVGALLGVGCAKPQERPAPPNLPVHTLAYGGDFMLGRRINLALFNQKAREQILGKVKQLFHNADLALVNGEGVISSGGMFADKGEPRPYMYRAHPNVVDVLADAGIDVVTVGNNHSGDYGPGAFREMLDRLSTAGIGYAGGGHNWDDARTPSYHLVGDIVVAIVGVDLTNVRHYRASEHKPGTLYWNAFKNGKQADDIVEGLLNILQDARRHAHVVLLSPHWGDNWKEEPAPHLRSIGKRLLKGGYDGIIGHSSHWFHGVEMVEGKPIIYDAGNLVVDYGGAGKAHQAFAWELSFSKAGITGLKGFPLRLSKNSVQLARGKHRDAMLSSLLQKSEQLGTSVNIEQGVATVGCDPRGLRGPVAATPPPKRAAPDEARPAKNHTVLDSVPEDATRVNVSYPGGIKLVGYKMLNNELTVPKGGQLMVLYWEAANKLDQNYVVHLEAQGLDQNGHPSVVHNDHFHGDWILPTSLWPAGKVIVDWTLFRLKFKPGGKVHFFAGLLNPRREPLTPIQSDAPLNPSMLIPLGESVYRKGTDGLFQVLERHLAPTVGGGVSAR